MGEVEKILITYKDGSEKVIRRGVCFSVYEEGEHLKVSCDGVAGSEIDEVAVLAVISDAAKEMGIYGFLERVKKCDGEKS